MVGLALIALGVVILVIGYVRLGVGPLYGICSECGDPMPDGYTAAEAGRIYCRRCCKRLSIRPWYYKDWMR